jgi:hypothetical protein
LLFDGAGHVVDAALKQRDTAYQSIAIGVERANLGGHKLRFCFQLGNTWRHSRDGRGFVRPEYVLQSRAGGFRLARNRKGRQGNGRHAAPTAQPQKRVEFVPPSTGRAQIGFWWR